ncbi:MAG: hypothetical protein O3A00_20715 [Planctomycetota bacterium]|nr:hypothetical protein [Planctomycetota bacterium]
MKRIVIIITAVVLTGMIPACRQERAYHHSGNQSFLPSSESVLDPMLGPMPTRESTPMPTPADQSPLKAPRVLDNGEANRVPPVLPATEPGTEQATRQIRGFRGPSDFK